MTQAESATLRALGPTPEWNTDTWPDADSLKIRCEFADAPGSRLLHCASLVRLPPFVALVFQHSADIVTPTGKVTWKVHRGVLSLLTLPCQVQVRNRRKSHPPRGVGRPIREPQEGLPWGRRQSSPARQESAPPTGPGAGRSRIPDVRPGQDILKG